MAINFRVRNKPLLAIVGILLVVSLFGIATAFDLPDYKTAKVPQINYVSYGVFNDTASLKPSYLFGPTPQPTDTAQPVSNMKYLASYIDHFKFSFNYKFTSDQALKSTTIQTSASASGKDSSGQPLTISLLNNAAVPGSTAAVSFDLIPTLLSGDINIEVDVYPTVQTAGGTIFESFSQTLTILSEGPIYEVTGGTEQTQSGSFGTLAYQQSGQLGYAVYTKASSPLGAVTLTPPATTNAAATPVPETTVGPGDLVFINLVDKMNGSFTYQFQSDKAVQDQTELVSVTAVLAGGNVWSKSVVVIPQTVESGPFSLSFPMDIIGFNQLLSDIKSETGSSSSANTLTFRVDVAVAAKSDYGPIAFTFSPSLSTSMDNGTIQWNESLTQSAVGSITTNETVPNNARYLGMAVSDVRVFSLFLTGFLFVAFVLLVYLSSKPAWLKSEGDNVDKKYGERMATAKTQTSSNGITTVSLGSMEDLVKVSDELAKPVIYEPPTPSKNGRLYYVLDGTTRYEYSLEE